MDWRIEHKKVLESFLEYLYEHTDNYVLKGGTALSQCYGLNRFSEDIDLDGKGHLIIDLCKSFSQKNGYEYRIAKDTDIVKRCMIHYGGLKPLKVEMSARRKNIPKNETTIINKIKVYNINTMAILKTLAYQQRDKIRDLYDVTFIINNYYEKLPVSTQIMLQNALAYKGLEHFDYIVNSQKDELINVSVLADNFLNACDKVGIFLERNDKEFAENDYNER